VPPNLREHVGQIADPLVALFAAASPMRCLIGTGAELVTQCPPSEREGIFVEWPEAARDRSLGWRPNRSVFDTFPDSPLFRSRRLGTFRKRTPRDSERPAAADMS
jgi:hypothetical protein